MSTPGKSGYRKGCSYEDQILTLGANLAVVWFFDLSKNVNRQATYSCVRCVTPLFSSTQPLLLRQSPARLPLHATPQLSPRAGPKHGPKTLFHSHLHSSRRGPGLRSNACLPSPLALRKGRRGSSACLLSYPSSNLCSQSYRPRSLSCRHRSRPMARAGKSRAAVDSRAVALGHPRLLSS